MSREHPFDESSRNVGRRSIPRDLLRHVSPFHDKAEFFRNRARIARSGLLGQSTHDRLDSAFVGSGGLMSRVVRKWKLHCNVDEKTTSEILARHHFTDNRCNSPQLT